MGKQGVVFIINLYRKYLSPLKGPCCRFYPSCSAYAAEAVARHGVLKGGAMAVWRVLRCNPFGRGGYDPVK
jgi:putative membrane protein insertion efficiency factor